MSSQEAESRHTVQRSEAEGQRSRQEHRTHLVALVLVVVALGHALLLLCDAHTSKGNPDQTRSHNKRAWELKGQLRFRCASHKHKRSQNHT